MKCQKSRREEAVLKAWTSAQNEVGLNVLQCSTAAASLKGVKHSYLKSTNKNCGGAQ